MNKVNHNKIRLTVKEKQASVPDKLRNVIKLSSGKLVHKHLKASIGGDTTYQKARVFRNERKF